MDENPPYRLHISVEDEGNETLSKYIVQHDHADNALAAFGHAVAGALEYYRDRRKARQAEAATGDDD